MVVPDSGGGVCRLGPRVARWLGMRCLPSCSARDDDWRASSGGGAYLIATLQLTRDLPADPAPDRTVARFDRSWRSKSHFAIRASGSPRPSIQMLTYYQVYSETLGALVFWSLGAGCSGLGKRALVRPGCWWRLVERPPEWRGARAQRALFFPLWAHAHSPLAQIPFTYLSPLSH